MAITAPVRLTAWEHNFVRLRTVQGEDDSRAISASIFERDNVPLDMSEYTASVYILERSGRKITEPAEISGNTITATVPYISSPGDAEVQFCLSRADSEMLKIVGLTLDVQPSDLENAAEASDEFNDLVAATTAAQEATTAAQNAAALANQTAEDIEERANSGEFDGASGTIDATTVTTFTGLLKGNGSSISVAAAGTDYATPAQVAAKQDAITASGILKGSGSAVSAAVAGTDYATPAQVAAKQDADDYAHLATPLTTGTSTAFVLTLNPPLTAYTTGMILAVRFHTSGNTGATLNINGLGAKTIYGLGSTLLLPISSGVHLLLYDGTYWRLMDSFLSAFGGTVRGSISPSSSSYSLGSSTSRWYNVHTTNLAVNGSSMDDFVTEQGTSGIWTYRKWKSGINECWGTTPEQSILGTDSGWDSWACGTGGAKSHQVFSADTYTFPVTFVEPPSLQITARIANCVGFVFWDGPSATGVPKVNVVSMDGARNITTNIYIHAIGK